MGIIDSVKTTVSCPKCKTEETQSAHEKGANMRLFRLSWGTAVPPLLLAFFAFLPLPQLRYTLYALLAFPLLPLIERFGWVYRDQTKFLTPIAAAFSGCVWAVILYFLICLVRYVAVGKRVPQ